MVPWSAGTDAPVTLRELLAAAGFKGTALDTAVAVSRAEDRTSDPRAHNDNPVAGDDSYGLFQVNMIGSLGPDRRARYGLSSNADLFDPATNARVAYAMSNGGTNWSAWSTFKNGAYKAFLGTDAPVTGGDSSSTSSTSATPAGLPGIPDPSQLGATIVKVTIIGTAIAAGAGLVLLGLNKATGYPGLKAAKAAATVAI